MLKERARVANEARRKELEEFQASLKSETKASSDTSAAEQKKPPCTVCKGETANCGTSRFLISLLFGFSNA